MEIQEIKSLLRIEEVLERYGLSVNKNKMIHCPFHDDKTPSMQVYPKTDSLYCFSGNCQLHGKSIDQIDFIMHKEGCTKAQAINKAKEMINGHETADQRPKTAVKKQSLAFTFHALQKNLAGSKKAQSYLESRNLQDVKLAIGYRGQKAEIKGMKDCLIFPLRNEKDEIVSFYGRSITARDNAETGKHYYSTGRKGLYPNYPAAETKTLILTESIIDSATLQSFTDYTILALYGTNGLTPEHKQGLTQLKHLQEVIFFLDGDDAGKAATKKHSQTLHEILPKVTISHVETPEGEDPNSLVSSHEPEILEHLISKREVLFSVEQVAPAGNHLNTENPEYIIYEKSPLQLVVLGGVNLFSLDKLKVTLRITRTDQLSPIYNIRQSNLDLYNDDATEKFIRKVSERLELGTREVQLCIAELINELEAYRLEQVELQKPNKPEQRELSEQRKEQVINWLSQPNLLQKTNDLIGKTGMVGEENNRLLMFLVFTSRLREQPLHIISLGASGTGKTYLQEKVSELIPQEHKLEITALSENALYYFERTELQHKLVLIEDLDGAQDEKILYAIRELMSKKKISKTIPIKDAKGNLKTVTLQVEGPICLAGTTTKEQIYEDNANRSLLIYLDNTKAHKNKIMEYQQNLSAGTINKQKEEEIKTFLQDVQLLLEKVKIRNPYATQLNIPETVFKPLRTNTHYLSFIETVTFYHQYQRSVSTDKQTGERYIETTLEDIEEANRLLKDVLLAKSDELTKGCRDFFERLKNHLEKEERETFYSSEIRKIFRMSPNNVKYYLAVLSRYQLVRVIGGHPRKQGYEYEIMSSKEYQTLQNELNNALDTALQNIKHSVVGNN
ncbi:MAG: CHC2 zinc finger domain-containing protein [Cyclobacteriaceae bacterium]